ncbi:PTS glucitol/sorbitol transporter subunit IIA [Anaerostipes sp.]|uniref:PTS glucitol/sorbitol transporter subunit IIA n=1 Tax=Anaerostipes sp. TaxID=1872530 RepID=UPI0025B8B78B|nr:PTS glucitol/sorbitol transporter subunit IIA [Anaerostipes sp.]MBS7009190.1 PTS glucitol/sorbitol transporter subunit IIA [Anaerostipes sp.]
MSQVIYKTQVIRLGSEAMDALDQNLLILFGQEVPEILEDMVFIHNNNKVTAEPEKGDCLLVDDQEFEILCVGEVVYQNLSQLGHCTLTFGENPDQEILPGSIYLKALKAPKAGPGSIIQIVRHRRKERIE